MNTEEREISLIDLFIYVAKGWRSILICMAVFAIGLGTFQYIKDLKSYKTYQAELEEQIASTEEQKEKAISTIAQLRKEMTDQEILAVNKLVRLEKEHDMQLEYNKNSLLMNMNPYNVSIARIKYAVDTDYVTNYAGVTHKDKTDDIVDAYINQIEDSEWRKKALKAAGVEAEVQYFSELIDISDCGDSFVITIKHSDEKQLYKMLPVVEEMLKNATVQIKEVYGSHDLDLVNKSIEVTVDNDIYNTQQSRKNTLLSLENNIVSYKNAFNDKQKSLYAGEILINENENEEATEETLQQEFETPSISVKYIIVGAVLGILVLCVVRAMVYILSDKLKAEDDIATYFGVPRLGYIQENQNKTNLGKIDAWLDSLSRRNYNNLSKEQQLQMIISNILLYCGKGNMKNIYFNSSINCTGEKAGEIISALKNRGIEVKEGFSILQDAKAMEDMSKCDGVVFIEQAGKSHYENMECEIKLCREHEKNVIGLIVLS